MYYLGIDLGGTNIAIGIVNEDYKIVKKGSTPTLSERDLEEVVKDIASLSMKLLEETNIDISEIAHAGIGSPGSIDPVNGVVISSNNIRMYNYPIVDVLKKYLPIENIYIDNDANAAALGEAMGGAAKGAETAVMVTLGTGVGSGIIINGKIFGGFNHAGGEIGHMVIEYDGEQCTCGRKGCWEAYSSATALGRMTREKLAETKDTLMWELVGGDINKASARTPFAAMKQGDKAGKEVVDKYVSYLACGITNIINIFQPNVLCIGGGVANEGHYLLDPVIEIAERDQFTAGCELKTKICVAELGNDAGIIGAAAITH